MDAEIFLFILNEPALVFLSELTQTCHHATGRHLSLKNVEKQTYMNRRYESM